MFLPFSVIVKDKKLEGFYESLDFNNISSLLITQYSTDWTGKRVDVKIIVIHVMSQ